MDWQDSNSELALRVSSEIMGLRRKVYRSDLNVMKSDYKTVALIYQGDYRDRQTFELIQNGADAIGEALPESRATGKIKIVLTKDGLYCANEGAPFTFEGLQALAYPIFSAKTGNQIGRYGQGFKSVLAVTDEPRIYSKSVSIHYSFNLASTFLAADPTPEEKLTGANNKISVEAMGTIDKPEVSILSIPFPVDPSEYFSKDSTLRELSSWASTIIHLPFSSTKRFSAIDRFTTLSAALKTFPAQFLIFTEHVGSLEIEIQDNFNEHRIVSCQPIDSPLVQLDDDIELRQVRVDEGGGKKQDWLVVTRPKVNIPDSAGNAGVQIETNRRRDPDTNALLPVPISWAVPLQQAADLGLFWCFFPTRDEAFTKGIMNAPWDTNNERTTVSPTAFNAYLLKEFGELVVKTIPALIAYFPDDLGKYFDYLPGRAYEEHSESGLKLNNQIQESMVSFPSVLDLEGKLQRPVNLRRPPSDINWERGNLELLNLWATAKGNDLNFPHPTVLANKKRLGRFTHVMEEADHTAGKQDMNLVSWLQEVVAQPSFENSVIAINLLKAIAELNFQKRVEVVDAKVLLCEDGCLVAPKPGSVFYATGKSSRTDIPIVDRRVMEADGIREFLVENCMITEADAAADFDVLLASWPASPSSENWKDFWIATSGSSSTEVIEALVRHPNVKPVSILNCEGSFVSCDQVFLPGSIFKSGEGDDDLVVDAQFHHDHIEILRSLGVSETPSPTGSSLEFPDEDGYMTYLSQELPDFKVTKKRKEKIFETAPKWSSQLKLLKQLQETSRSKFTTWALGNIQDHSSWNPERGPITVDSPGFWFVKKYGMVETSLGPREFDKALSSSMVQFGRVAPVSTVDPEITIGCGLKSVFSDLSVEVLTEVLQNLSGEVDSLLIGECLSAICRSLKVPDHIPCKVNNAIEMKDPSTVAVVIDQEFFGKLAMNGEPVVIAPNNAAAESLVSEWGLLAGDGIQQEFEPTSPSEPTLLADMFSLLNEMHPRLIAGVNVVKCQSLVHVIQGVRGQIRTNAISGLSKGILFVAVDGTLSDEVVLKAANDRLKLNLSDDDVREVIKNANSNAINEHFREVRNAKGDVEKIKILFNVEQMRSLLPVKLLDEIVAEANDPQILSEMLIAVHGPQLLEKAKNILSSKGLRPPGMWAGSQTAIQFISELGFERAYAGFKEPDRAAHMEVKGKSTALNLHTYQLEVKAEIKNFIAREKVEDKWRATLYLPTGAGKTRVTVQAILELMNEGKLKDKPVIWIAQSYELCEQAVQAFAEVWSEIGTTGNLSLDRFWDDKSVEQASIPDEYVGQVVVAVDAKVASAAVGNEKYKWLQNSSLVVVDEAHRGGSKSYTRILSWLETGVRSFKGKTIDKRPVLGLTATPAKKGIEGRFGPRMIRIPDDVIGAGMTDVEYLRSIKVLAKAEHKLLPGVTWDDLGEIVVLGDEEEDFDSDDLGDSDNETDSASTNRPQIWLPKHVEEELAENRERNASIISSILSLDPSWPVIVFALSVSHSQLLAALLAKNGVKSASVSSDTKPGIRKLYISDFRSGKIRVLTNYGVLTTGFDAPKVQAIYIARPTFSKSLYLQMIGRGLRGPLNGGTDECLIVDIADNFVHMNIDAAYKEMGDWWTSSEGEPQNISRESADT
jgi:superfamily II DNA or RNA helicase